MKTLVGGVFKNLDENIAMTTLDAETEKNIV